VPINTGELAGLNRDAEVYLYELNLSLFGEDEPVRLTRELYPDGSLVKFGGKEYTAIAIKLEGQKVDARNQIATPTLTIGEIFDVSHQLLIGSFVAKYDDLVGATIRETVTFARHLDAGDEPAPLAVIRSEIYTIERKKSGSRIAYVFELSTGNNLQGAKLPQREVTNNCSWKQYRGDGCAYVGAPIEDINGNPLVPVRLAGCTLSGRTIGNPDIAASSIAIGDAVVGTGIPFGTVVKAIAEDGLSVKVSKDLTPGTMICWFAPEVCGRLRLSCKRRFGIDRQIIVAPGAAIVTSPATKRGQFNGMAGHFIHCNNLGAGLPVARRIKAVLPSPAVAISAFAFQIYGNERRWVFTCSTVASVGSKVAISGVHPLVDQSYVLGADSFAGVGANQFAVLAKTQDIVKIERGATNTLIEMTAVHQFATGDTIYIQGTNTDGGFAINGTHSIGVVPSPTTFRIGYLGLNPYTYRDRASFSSPDYMSRYKLGSTVLNSVEAANQEGKVYFATSLTPSSASYAILDDCLQLDLPIDSSAIAGEYTAIVGGKKFSGLLNFGGQPGASVVNF
jgi:lambda family phage minor tail protein L